MLIFILSIAILGYKIASSDAYINKANEKMDIDGFKLLMKESPSKDMQGKGFSNIGGFGCTPYENQKDGLRITFSGFPDVLDEYVLTDIETTNPNYNFYDIRVGDDIKRAENILINNGFSRNDVNNSSNYSQFNNKKLVITFTLDEEAKIKTIRIFLASTNKQKVVF
jgi:hypothetical protein